MSEKLKAFIGNAYYEPVSQIVFRKTEAGDRILCDIRGWVAIQNLFKKKGLINQSAAAKFQDEIGAFIADAINEKINSSNEPFDPNKHLGKEWETHSGYYEKAAIRKEDVMQLYQPINPIWFITRGSEFVFKGPIPTLSDWQTLERLLVKTETP